MRLYKKEGHGAAPRGDQARRGTQPQGKKKKKKPAGRFWKKLLVGWLSLGHRLRGAGGGGWYEALHRMRMAGASGQAGNHKGWE